MYHRDSNSCLPGLAACRSARLPAAVRLEEIRSVCGDIVASAIDQPDNQMITACDGLTVPAASSAVRVEKKKRVHRLFDTCRI